MESKKSVVLRAPLLSMSGYGTHARQIATWLLKLSDLRSDLDVTFDIVPWGATPWHVNPDACDGLIGRVIQNVQKRDNYDVSLQLQLPNEWNPFMAKTNIGLTAAVETDRCNPAWIDAVNRMDMVIVPSEFTKKVFENTGDVKTPINVVPESWLESCRTVERGKSPLDLQLDTDFNFLIVSQFTGNNPENDRKNLCYTIKWMMEQFKDNPEVGIVLKTNFGRQTSIDKQNVMKTLTQVILETRQGPGPRVHLLHGHMSNEEIAGLYTHPKIKALLNLTRGEGFCLPALEAAACGLPVIATGWSAHTEFLGLGKYVKVDYNLVQIHQTRVDNQIFMSEARWAQPIEGDAKRKIKRFVESSATPTAWAKELQVTLREKYSPEAVEAIYAETLKEII